MQIDSGEVPINPYEVFSKNENHADFRIYYHGNYDTYKHYNGFHFNTEGENIRIEK